MEWLLFSLLVILAAVPLLKKLWSYRVWAFALAISFLVLTVVSARIWDDKTAQKAKARENLAKVSPRPGRPGGFVSSDKCQSCHPDQYASWHASFHRTMTQTPSTESVMGNFNGLTLEVDGEAVRLERRGEEFWVELGDPDWKNDRGVAQRDFLAGKRTDPPPPLSSAPRVWKPISMVTGSHNFQAYWIPSGAYGNVQYAFPFAWLVPEKRWIPRKDTFIRDPDQPSPIQIWNMNCIQCHSTGGQPRKEPGARNFDTRVAELGISCESCHGPAEAHVAANSNPSRRYQFRRGDAADPTIVNPSKLDAQASTQVCGQCHSIKWNLERDNWLLHGFQFRPGDDLQKAAPIIRPAAFHPTDQIPEALKHDTNVLQTMFWPDGMIRVTGREYNGLLDSPCHQKGELSCLSCHSMHKSHPKNQMAARMESNEACFQCHETFRARLEEHTHHPAQSSGSLCYNCHMPHNTYGLLKAVRNHQISNPTVQSQLSSGRPNACNLCHLDQTLRWTATQLQNWYKQPPVSLSAEDEEISSALLLLLKGDAAQRALIAWNLGRPEAKAASGEQWMGPFLAQLLGDPYPAVRFMAQRTLKTFPEFANLDFDVISPEPDRSAARTRVMDAWRQKNWGKLDRIGPHLLLHPDGSLQQSLVERLLLQRNNRIVELIE